MLIPPYSNLTDAVMVHAAERPHSVALIEGTQSLTYGELGALLVRATTFLSRSGVLPGQRTGIAMTNGIDHTIILLALLRMGAEPVELPAEAGAPSVLQVARKFGIRIVLTDPDLKLAAATGGHAAVIEVRIDLDWRAEIAALPADAGAASGLDTLTLITLTGGSTGIPAGAVITHRQWLERIALRQQVLRHFQKGLDQPPPVLIAASPRYTYFLCCMLVQFCDGGALVLLPEYARGIDLLRAVACYRDALCFVTANICRFFLHSSRPGKMLLPNLRLLEFAGQPLSAEEKRVLTTRVTPNFADSFGTGSAGFITTIIGPELLRKPGSVGLPQPGIEIEIVDTNGANLSHGTVGRLRCRGPGFASGMCPEDSATPSPECFRDGWYYTGDLGSLDEDGYLFLHGRIADVVRREGVEVFANDIEMALVAHPSVRDVAVIGRPSQRLGEEIVAFVVSNGPQQHDDLARHCRAALPSDRWPDHVFYIDALPRNAGGKVERLRLRALADARLAQTRP